MIVSRWVRVTGLNKGGYGRNADKTLVGRSVEKYLVDRDVVGSTRLEFTVKEISWENVDCIRFSQHRFR